MAAYLKCLAGWNPALEEYITSGKAGKWFCLKIS
jgi:hypothetical protein